MWGGARTRQLSQAVCLKGTHKPEVNQGHFMLGKRIAPQSEVMRAVLLGGTVRCCARGAPHPQPINRGMTWLERVAFCVTLRTRVSSQLRQGFSTGMLRTRVSLQLRRGLSAWGPQL